MPHFKQIALAPTIPFNRSFERLSGNSLLLEAACADGYPGPCDYRAVPEDRLQIVTVRCDEKGILNGCNVLLDACEISAAPPELHNLLTRPTTTGRPVVDLQTWPPPKSAYSELYWDETLSTTSYFVDQALLVSLGTLTSGPVTWLEVSATLHLGFNASAELCLLLFPNITAQEASLLEPLQE